MGETQQIIRTPAAPHSPLFSQAIKVGSTIYVSGTAGIDPGTNQLAGLTIQEQTRQALINCESILRAAGAKLENVVEVHELLARAVASLTGSHRPIADVLRGRLRVRCSSKRISCGSPIGVPADRAVRPAPGVRRRQESAHFAAALLGSSAGFT